MFRLFIFKGMILEDFLCLQTAFVTEGLAGKFKVSERRSF